MQFRAFSVDHSKLRVHVIGDFNLKDEADEAVYLDKCDEPSPDKELYFSWHVTGIANSLKIGATCS
jgi:hypothetical protein